MRTLRVFRHEEDGGDFYLVIPDDARVTFGYFNPASAQPQPPHIRLNDDGWRLMRRTALRVYEGASDKKQMACYLGVTGFRDVAIKQRAVRVRREVQQPAPPDMTEDLIQAIPGARVPEDDEVPF